MGYSRRRYRLFFCVVLQTPPSLGEDMDQCYAPVVHELEEGGRHGHW